MSQFQSKGDRSEAQLRKPARSGSGLTYQRAGGSSSIVKGSGAGGPSPSASASLGHHTSSTSQSGQVSGPVSGSKGGKRSNGATGQPKGVSTSGPSESDSNNTVQSHSLHLQQQQLSKTQPVVADAQVVKQHPPSVPSCNEHISRSSKSGMASSYPATGSTEPVAPVMTTAVAGDVSRGNFHPPFSFQFGSISPSFMHNTGVQIPARTSSAPPNLDEQMCDQARFGLSAVSPVKVPVVSAGQLQQQTGPETAGFGQASAPILLSGQQQELLSAHHSTNMLEQSVQINRVSSVPAAGFPVAQPQQALITPAVMSQGQGHSSLSGQYLQVNSHLQPQISTPPKSHLQIQAHIVAAQAQVHTQHQSLLQQPIIQQTIQAQQGLMQQNPGQSMKFPQPVIPPPLASQIVAPSITSLSSQLASQQLPTQMVHQLGPQLGVNLGNQIPSGIPGIPYCPSATSQYIQPRMNRAVKIVHPETHEELKFDTKSKKGDAFTENGGLSMTGASGRVSANGSLQPRPPVGYGNVLAHQMNMNFYPGLQSGPYGHSSQSYYPSAPPKSGVPTVAVGTSSGRLNFTHPSLGHSVPFLNNSVSSGPVSTSRLGPASAGSPDSLLINRAPATGDGHANVKGTFASKIQPAGHTSLISSNKVKSSALATVSAPASAEEALCSSLEMNGKQLSLGLGLVEHQGTLVSSSQVATTNSGTSLKFGDLETSGAVNASGIEPMLEDHNQILLPVAMASMDSADPVSVNECPFPKVTDPKGENKASGIASSLDIIKPVLTAAHSTQVLFAVEVDTIASERELHSEKQQEVEPLKPSGSGMKEPRKNFKKDSRQQRLVQQQLSLLSQQPVLSSSSLVSSPDFIEERTDGSLENLSDSTQCVAEDTLASLSIPTASSTGAIAASTSKLQRLQASANNVGGASSKKTAVSKVVDSILTEKLTTDNSKKSSGKLYNQQSSNQSADVALASNMENIPSLTGGGIKQSSKQVGARVTHTRQSIFLADVMPAPSSEVYITEAIEEPVTIKASSKASEETLHLRGSLTAAEQTAIPKVSSIPVEEAVSAKNFSSKLSSSPTALKSEEIAASNDSCLKSLSQATVLKDLCIVDIDTPRIFCQSPLAKVKSAVDDSELVLGVASHAVECGRISEVSMTIPVMDPLISPELTSGNKSHAELAVGQRSNANNGNLREDSAVCKEADASTVVLQSSSLVQDDLNSPVDLSTGVTVREIICTAEDLVTTETIESSISEESRESHFQNKFVSVSSSITPSNLPRTGDSAMDLVIKVETAQNEPAILTEAEASSSVLGPVLPVKDTSGNVLPAVDNLQQRSCSGANKNAVATEIKLMECSMDFIDGLNAKGVLADGKEKNLGNDQEISISGNMLETMVLQPTSRASEDVDRTSFPSKEELADPGWKESAAVLTADVSLCGKAIEGGTENYRYDSASELKEGFTSTNEHTLGDHVEKDNPGNSRSTSSNPGHQTDTSGYLGLDIKMGSKKKKKKELLARADAAGTTADLYNAYKAPEEKQDQVKVVEMADTPAALGEAKKNPMAVVDNMAPKELDDWEDAAELPPPKVTAGHTDASIVLNAGFPDNHFLVSTVDRKYTRDFMLTFKDQNRELPQDFEIRADVAELLLDPQAVIRSLTNYDVLQNPGRTSDQPTGGSSLDWRSTISGNSDEDRWTKQPGLVPSPGRGDIRTDLGLTTPSGSFRPGIGLNPGLIARIPVGIRPGMPMANSSVIPLMPVPVSAGFGRGSGVDADRWQHSQKGLIPSPQTLVPVIHKAEKKYEVGRVSGEEELKQRQIKGILNKLTPQNFDRLFEQVKEVNIASAHTLTGVISQIFDKALMEPFFCEMYAKFCVQLAAELPEFSEDGVKITFKRVLLNKCQEEFEQGEREQAEADKVEEEGEVKLSSEEREGKKLKARRRMLGNIRFIGELYKKCMLTERIMHGCILKLLGEYQNPDEEDVEALCKLMSTIGQMIDHPKAKEHIDVYFDRIVRLSGNQKLPSRLRFMLKDVIDLRRNGWQERRKVEGPKRIDEVHRDAVQERQVTAAQANRLSRGSGMGPLSGRRLASPQEFGARGPISPLFTPLPTGNAATTGVLRGLQQPPMGIRGAYGQDVRTEDRLLLENRAVPIPLSQRTVDDVPITLGPQGGLGRGMSVRGQPLSSCRSALVDLPPIPPMIHGERRLGSALPGYSTGLVPDRGTVSSRDDFPQRASVTDRPPFTSERPLLERPTASDRYGTGSSGRDYRSVERTLTDRPAGTSKVFQHQSLPSVAAVANPSLSLPLTEEQLKRKSRMAIEEYYSVMDFKEASQCVDELKSPNFHSTMVSLWVSDSLEKKDMERELLAKLLIYLNKTEPFLVKQDQILKGFEVVLDMLEDITVDAPKAPDYLAVMLGKLIVGGVFSLAQVGKLLKEMGMEPEKLLQSGDGLNILGGILKTIRGEKGEADMLELFGLSALRLEDFILPEDRQTGRLTAFLEKRNLQCLYPMKAMENQLQEFLNQDEPTSEILRWLERRVPSSMYSDPTFVRMIMVQVLRHSVPPAFKDYEKSDTRNSLGFRMKKYAPMLRLFSSGTAKPAETTQREYIAAVQLFIDELGHPPGLMTTLFSCLYEDEVISESAFVKWQDDVHDSTPGRAKAIREVGKWLSWLATAPEETWDDNNYNSTFH